MDSSDALQPLFSLGSRRGLNVVLERIRTSDRSDRPSGRLRDVGEGASPPHSYRIDRIGSVRAARTLWVLTVSIETAMERIPAARKTQRAIEVR